MNDNKKMKFLKIFIFIITISISLVSTVYIFIKAFTFNHKMELLTENDINEIVSKYECSGTSTSEDDVRVDYAFSTDDSCPFFMGYMIINDSDYLDTLYLLYEAEAKSYSTYTSNVSFDLIKFKYYDVEVKDTINMKVVRYQNSILVLATSRDDVELFDDLIIETGYYYKVNIEYFKYMFIPLLSFFVGIFSLSYINKRDILK